MLFQGFLSFLEKKGGHGYGVLKFHPISLFQLV